MMVDAARGDAVEPRRGIQAIALGPAARARLVPLIAAVRSQTAVPVFVDYGDRKLQAHFKLADRNRARWALILGDDELAANEVVFRDLEARSDLRLPFAEAAGSVARAVVEGTANV